MNPKWPMVPLGEVLTHVPRPVDVKPDETYREIGIRSHGKGIFHKQPVTGMELGNKRVFWIEPGDFVLNIVFAWEGAVAVTGPDEVGMIGSHRFPTFRADESRLDPRYLVLFFRTTEGLALLGRVSPGGAGRNRTLSRQGFQQQTVPLPPVAEQRRVVQAIDRAMATLGEVKALRDGASRQADDLLPAACEVFLNETESQFPAEPLERLVDSTRGISYGIVQTGVETAGGIPTLRAGDVRWFECNQTSLKRVAPEVERGYERTRLRGGELLLRIRGGVGALAVCPPELAGSNVSREIAVIPLIEGIEPRYAMFLLAAPTSQERMAGHVRGTSYVGINLRDVRGLRLPLPPRSEQQRIVASLDLLMTKVLTIKAFQTKVTEALRAAVPSILARSFGRVP